MEHLDPSAWNVGLVERDKRVRAGPPEVANSAIKETRIFILLQLDVSRLTIH